MIDDRINDLFPNVPNTDKTCVHDHSEIHCDSNQLKSSACGRNAEDVAAPSSTTPSLWCKQIAIFLCISTDH